MDYYYKINIHIYFLQRGLYSSNFFCHVTCRLDFLLIFNKILPQLIDNELSIKIKDTIYSKKYFCFSALGKKQKYYQTPILLP